MLRDLLELPLRYTVMRHQLRGFLHKSRRLNSLFRNNVAIAMIFSLVLLFILVGRVLKSASNNNPLLESGRDPSWDPLPKIYSVYDVNERIPDAASSVARVLKTGIRSRETIFVSVAAYRDDLCSKTINELFSKADDWTKIFVGVCDQIDERSNDKGCLTGIDPKFESHIRVIQMPADEGKGPTYARYLVSQLWDGEEFFLMIDSHSEFADKWDSLVHDQLVKRMKHRKTAFSHYPANINSGILGKIGHDPTWICGAHFKDGAPQGLTIQRASGCHAKHRYEGLCTSPFIGAGFFFAPAYEFLSDVPFDPYLPFLFHGEELLIGARLWTHGWDVYVPPVTLVGHVYGSKEKNVFTDHSQTWVHQNQQSGLRARYLLKEYEGPPPDMREIDILGMGQSRSLEWYMYFAGLNLKLKVESNRCDSKYDPVQQIWIPV